MISGNVNQTKKIAVGLAKKILKLRRPKQGLGQQAMIIGLTGELGSGKTTFCQSFGRALGVKEKIHSPTFVLMKKFSIFISQFSNLYHMDCYRIKKIKEILDLEWKEIIKNPKNIVIVEWAEKIKKILPKKYIRIDFRHKDKKTRWIKIKKF